MRTMAWDIVHITEAIAEGLQARAQADDLEQAVYSIDALDELGLHPLIQQSLRVAGFGVHPEQRYPSDRTARRKSEGKRCDIVLTPDERDLMDPHAESTLFEPPDAMVLEAAFWLEIKTVSQYTTEGPFARYSAELLQPVSKDVKKLSGDPLVYHAALLLVLFTADEATAQHDLTTWERKTLDRGYAVAPPIIRQFPINDRLGTGHCAVGTYQIRRL